MNGPIQTLICNPEIEWSELLSVSFRPFRTRNINTAAAFANWLAPKKSAPFSLIYLLGHSAYIIFRIIMSFRKLCHMPFRKLIPSFTLTERTCHSANSFLLLPSLSEVLSKSHSNNRRYRKMSTLPDLTCTSLKFPTFTLKRCSSPVDMTSSRWITKVCISQIIYFHKLHMWEWMTE